MFSFYLPFIDKGEEKEKLEMLYKLYHKKMWYAANVILNNWDDADDAVQNAFLAIAKNMNSIHTVNSSETYAYVITAAQNMALNIISQKTKRNFIDYENVWNLTDEKTLLEIYTIENRDLILCALMKLPQLYQECLYLYYFDSLSEKEIAKLLNRKPATIRKQIQRGKQKLFKILSTEDELFESNE